MLGHKTSFGKFKKIKIISSVFSDHNSMRLEIDRKERTAKNSNTWRLNNMLLNNQWITEELKEEISGIQTSALSLFSPPTLNPRPPGFRAQHTFQFPIPPCFY